MGGPEQPRREPHAGILHYEEWGPRDGAPLIALHPLGIDGGSLAGLGAALARHGWRTFAVDLPGFGRTPAPDAPLTPACLAAPVIELAARLDPPPAILGLSMGGRVALEAALVAPERFRAVIPVAPYLPWLRFRALLPLARAMDPKLVERIPLERAWPVLRLLADALGGLRSAREDDVFGAGVRMIYHSACPATRSAIVSAAREMALDPAYGHDGLWSRLGGLKAPAAFVWGERDRLVPVRFALHVSRAVPAAPQLLLPCLGHALHGPHLRCLAGVVEGLLGRGPQRSGGIELAGCRLTDADANGFGRRRPVET